MAENKENIRTQKTPEQIIGETQRTIDSAKKILEKNRKKYGEDSDIYKKMLKEFEDTRKSAIDILLDNKENTSLKLLELKKSILEKEFKEMIESQNPLEQNEFLYGEKYEYIYLKTFSNEKLMSAILSEEELNKIYLEAKLDEYNQIIELANITLDNNIIDDLELAGIGFNKQKLYLKEAIGGEIGVLSDLQMFIDKELKLNKKTSLKSVIDTILKTDNGYLAGTIFRYHIIGAKNLYKTDEIKTYFENDIKSILIKNPKNLEKFFELWGKENSGENNLKTGLKLKEIETIIPELKKKYIENLKADILEILPEQNIDQIINLNEKEILNLNISEKQKKELLSKIIRIKEIENELDYSSQTKGTYLEGLSATQLLRASNTKSSLLDYVNNDKKTEITKLSKNYSEILENKIYIEKLNKLSEEEFKKVIKNINSGVDFKEAIFDIDLEYSKSETIVNTIYNGGNYTITTNSGIILDGVSEEEKTGIQNSPEGLNNLIQFKKTLDDLNLGFVWKNRADIILALKNSLGANNGFDNLDADSISKDDFLKILNFILKVIGKKGNHYFISEAIDEVREINDANFNKKRTDLFGRSVIENMFIEKGYLKLHSAINKIDIYALSDKNNWLE